MNAAFCWCGISTVMTAAITVIRPQATWNLFTGESPGRLATTTASYWQPAQPGRLDRVQKQGWQSSATTWHIRASGFRQTGI